MLQRAPYGNWQWTLGQAEGDLDCLPPPGLRELAEDVESFTYSFQVVVEAVEAEPVFRVRFSADCTGVCPPFWLEDCKVEFFRDRC
jgi:hypothetical protein